QVGRDDGEGFRERGTDESSSRGIGGISSQEVNDASVETFRKKSRKQLGNDGTGSSRKFAANTHVRRAAAVCGRRAGCGDGLGESSPRSWKFNFSRCAGPRRDCADCAGQGTVSGGACEGRGGAAGVCGCGAGEGAPTRCGVHQSEYADGRN